LNTAWPACFPFIKKMVLSQILKKIGLSAVEIEPSKPYTGYYVTRGEKRYFQVIYADRAVSKACVNCHNTHLLSPKRNPTPGDVIDGMIISFPVD
jgi:hypothetical protein